MTSQERAASACAEHAQDRGRPLGRIIEATIDAAVATERARLLARLGDDDVVAIAALTAFALYERNGYVVNINAQARAALARVKQLLEKGT